MNKIKTYICGCAKDVGCYLDDVFNNIGFIGELFDDFHIIIYYDESDDNTLVKLNEYYEYYQSKMTVLIGKEPLTNIRTQNIANARNGILTKIKEFNNDDFQYFIMMDMDEVCSSKFNKNALDTYLQYERTNNPLSWDALSFNRIIYYDLWALSIDPYGFSCNHYENTHKVKNQMIHFLKEELGKVILKNPNTGLLPCISAFNGFAIYRKDQFINIKYEWNIHKTLIIYPRLNIDKMSRVVFQQPISRHDDCEHRYFHIRASQLNKARICISPSCLFI